MSVLNKLNNGGITMGESKIWLHRSSNDFRYWLHWGRTIWHYEGYLLKNAKNNSIGVDLGGDENDFTIHCGIKGLFNFYFGVEDFFPRKFMHRLFGYDTRNYGISLFEEYISIEFHRDGMGYAEGWKGKHIMFDWKSFLFGKMKYNKEDLGEHRLEISLPEGKYPATVQMFKSTWTRKRLVKPLVRYRAEVIPDMPLPIPGKGENSWDIDDDGIHSSTLEARSPEEAAKKVAEDVLKTRKKYAGSDWIPADGFSV